MKDKEIVFYDDTHNEEMYDDARESLFDRESDEYGWLSPDDIPDDMIYDEIDDINYITFEDFKNDLDRFIRGGLFIIQGTCGRWNGPAACGRFIRSFADIQAFVQHLDYIKFYELNGHFYISGYHHDGSDLYEMKQLTQKGVAYAERYDFAHDRYLHNEIMNSSIYSKLPRVNKAIYGG